MLYLIDIAWERRKPEPGRPNQGIATYAEAARSFQSAKNKAVRKFNRHCGTYFAITSITEKQDPAGIFS